jgi:hypothetical protein
MNRAVFLLVACIVLALVLPTAAAPVGVHEPGTGLENLNVQETEQGATGQAGSNASEQGTNRSQQAGLNETGQGAAQGPQTGQNLSTPGTGQEQQEQVQQETQNIGENETIRVQQQEQVRVQNASELHEMLEQREREMNQELQTLDEPQQLVYQNQNRVRLTVESLMATADLAGELGPQMVQLAEELNASVNATIRAEERIQTRNTVVRVLFGGDAEAAREIEQQVIQNQERIRELQALLGECTCDAEVRAILQKQLQNAEQEQLRLQQVAANELQANGLLGWLWK